MKAIILAAGMATRLHPLTLDTPKCLLKVGDYSLLHRSISSLVKNGITDFVIVTGYLHEKIESFVKKQYGESIHTTFMYNENYASTNNIYSLWLAKEEAMGKEILLLDSDLLYDERIITQMLSCKQENALALVRHPLGEEEIKVIIDKRGNILEINKTCNPIKAIGESLGIEKMSCSYTLALYKELEKMINQEHLENSFYELAFEHLIPKGHTFTIVDVTNYFSCELDTVEDFENAKQRIPFELFQFEGVCS